MNVPKIEFITQIKECRFRISNSLVKAAQTDEMLRFMASLQGVSLFADLA